MMEKTSTSLSLIIRIQSRDCEAWKRFVELYGPLVYHWLRRAKLQDADAADVVQDVFEAVSQSIDSFRSEGRRNSFRGWLWGITRHKLLDYRRWAAKSPKARGGTTGVRRFELTADACNDDMVEANTSGIGADLAQRALSLIRTDFRENTWKAFWRVTVDGQSPTDVAQSLGMSVVAVYKAKSRVLSHLRTEFDGLLD